MVCTVVSILLLSNVFLYLDIFDQCIIQQTNPTKTAINSIMSIEASKGVAFNNA